jgi:RNA polymerase sigma-70 factor (ECF subfamily)
MDDQRLIRELKRGDKEALRRIYLEHKDTLLTVATSMLHDVYAAEDVLHDVFVAFASGVRSLDVRISLRRYLITCVVNKVRDRFRRKRPRLVEIDEAGPLRSATAGPDGRAAFNEDAARLAEAIAALPVEQRETIVLHLNAGLTFREISEMQGISLSTVQGRYRYGLDKLRTALTGDQGQ